ncbi:ionotropic receptor 40a [Drosophila biarmipes]|uniref:ionotropic receptor 40a n=1 Tax=Drosophila biarmipes TaxID=125945 RepID=UPI001CDADADB|nr:ionotropic receptor 40a [Drosophila biarmipes]
MEKLLPAWGLLLYLFNSLDGGRLTTNICHESNTSIALSQIISGLRQPLLCILVPSTALDEGCQNDSGFKFNEFLQRLNQIYYKSVIFSDTELFFQHIENHLQGANECISLIFDDPKELLHRLYYRRLAHRLSLFIFYWGARLPPRSDAISFREPLRAVVITCPRQNAFRIYYNQARPCSVGHLQLVNWYDGESLGLQRIPLLPTAASVYANFEGRTFLVPVFHSPPWFWVTYYNNSYEEEEIPKVFGSTQYIDLKVTGGRDHRLLKVLAKHMNFRFKYIDAPGRTQGSIRSDNAKESNDSFTGGIGMLQFRRADLFLGDVGLGLERRKAVEFSFFTLADSGAFATHAPRRLNEAFAIMRPFKPDIWPYLILTILFSGPIFYCIIAMPYIWRRRCVYPDIEHFGKQMSSTSYIKEITPRKLMLKPMMIPSAQQMPFQLFDKCIWFALRLFLKQSCQELYYGYRAKFLTIVYWISATYVLADVYSAQLTSQFARPAREAPINTLQHLQAAMIHEGYQLYVEKESSSLEMLENGTELFRQLHALMRQQQPGKNQTFFIDSVEAGIQMIASGSVSKVVLGGRETLYFNIQQYGAYKFQLSQKLYTRYSAVAVQIGCPFLDSLNNVLMHLFEGGILEKMTTAEYATQARKISMKGPQQYKDVTKIDKGSTNMKNSRSQNRDSDDISPLNLGMLQGAFIALFVGALAAGAVLLFEFIFNQLSLG